MPNNSHHLLQPFISPMRYVLISLVVVAGLFPSCKKESGCSDCVDGNRPPAINDTARKHHAPVPDAGSDHTIMLPATISVLDGTGSSDPDDNIKTYLWTKIAGPSSFHIVNSDTVITPVEDLQEGVYHFELRLTDSSGLSDTDTVQIVVLKQRDPCTACRIVFVSDRDGNSEIYSCREDGSDIRRLTNYSGEDKSPSWSPDGSRIAFLSDRHGGMRLYTMNADGSDVIQLTSVESEYQNLAWSPDGTKIAFSAVSAGSAGIWVVNSSTYSIPSLLFDQTGYDAQAAWSPDGMRIAVVSDWAAYDMVFDVYTIYADGTGFRPITDNMFDFQDYFYPSWSPDATKLALNVVVRDAYNDYTASVGIIDDDGDSLVVIPSSAVPMTKTSWSGDGTRIAYTSSNQESTYNVSWISTDGSQHGTIVTNGWHADWQR